MTRAEVRKWLGDLNLGTASLDVVIDCFSNDNLFRRFGTNYSFREADEARDMAVKMWRERHGIKS